MYVYLSVYLSIYLSIYLSFYSILFYLIYLIHLIYLILSYLILSYLIYRSICCNYVVIDHSTTPLRLRPLLIDPQIKMPCSSSALLQGKCLPTICNHLQGKQYDYADFTQPKLVYEGVHKWGTPTQ